MRIYKPVFIVVLVFTFFTASVECKAQKSAAEYLRNAVEATENKNYTGAIQLCDQSIALDSMNELAYYHRAFNRFITGDYQGTIDDTTKSIELNGSIADTYLLRAEARMKMGERINALSDYNKARRLDSTGTITHFAKSFFKLVF